MDVLETVRLWLVGQGIVPAVDRLTVAEGDTGLFPLGRQVLWEKEDVLGGVRRRVRYDFLLRQMAIPGEDTAKKLLALQEATTNTPPDLGEGSQFRGVQGKITKKAATGLGIYELRLIAEREETQ